MNLGDATVNLAFHKTLNIPILKANWMGYTNPYVSECREPTKKVECHLFTYHPMALLLHKTGSSQELTHPQY